MEIFRDLENQSIGVSLRYPTLNDIGSDLSDRPESEQLSESLKIMSNCIVTIFTENEVIDVTTEKQTDIINFIESLNNEQFKRLSSFFEDIPSVKLDMEFDCSKCEKSNKQEIKGLKNFFQ